MSKRFEKHIPYFVVLEAMRSGPGCFLCYLERNTIESYFEELFYEHVNDPVVRQTLRLSAGYCSRHAGFLLAKGDSYGTAVLYADQVQEFLTLFDSLEKTSKRGRQKFQKVLVEHAGCPACVVQLAARQRYMEVFKEWFYDEELHDSFLNDGLLCVPHFTELLSYFRDKKDIDLLCQTMREKCRKLLKDLEEFRAKSNWQRAHEQLGRERDSWYRVVEFFVGAKGIFR